MREDHELLDKYWFLNTITDTNGVTNALNLSYEETKALQRFCTVEEDINCWQRLQMYLLGMEHAMELLELLKIGRTCKGDEIMLSSYKQTGNKEDTEKERGETNWRGSKRESSDLSKSLYWKYEALHVGFFGKSKRLYLHS